jgi:hypothetical protein
MKLVVESIEDVLRPKQADEISVIYEDLEKEFNDYLVKSNNECAVFIFNIDNPTAMKDFHKLNVQNVNGSPFSQSFDRAQKYIKMYFDQSGPFIFVVDKAKGKFYLTQHGIDFVTDSTNQYVQNNAVPVSSDEFLKKYL